MNLRQKILYFLFASVLFLAGSMLSPPIEVSAGTVGTIKAQYSKTSDTSAVITVQTTNVTRTRLPDGNWSTQPTFTYTVSKNGVYDFEGEVNGGDRVQGSVIINDLRQTIKITNNRNVTLNLKADDTLSGVTHARFKNESAGSWSAYEGYRTSKEWVINDGEGLKTVYVQYKDYAGNESTPNTDKVYLDLNPPNVSFTINGGQQYTKNNVVTLNFSITDTISSISKILISNDNSTWTEISPTTSTQWTIPATNGNRTVYVKARDSVGNTSQAVSRSIYYDITQPFGTIQINNGATATNTRDVNLTLTFGDAHSGVSKVRVIEGSNMYEFPTVPSSPTTIPWTLALGNTGQVTMEVVDKAGNTYRVNSNVINIITLKITQFKLTGIINPLSFDSQSPFIPKVWTFSPQPMMSGGEIRFEVYYDLYDQGAVSSTSRGNYTVQITGNNYDKTINATFVERVNVPGKGFAVSFVLPNDAPNNAKVYVSAQVDATVTTANSSVSQTAYFPGPGNSTKAQIGYIQGNIREALEFNEVE